MAGSIERKLDVLRDAYNGERGWLLTCGPSINDIPAADLARKLEGELVISVKQTLDLLGGCADFHLLNSWNTKQYQYPSFEPIILMERGPEDPPIPEVNWDLCFPITGVDPSMPRKVRLANRLAQRHNFEDYLFDRGLARPWGPGVVYELGIYLAVHLGLSELISVGWDIGERSTTHMEHFYDGEQPQSLKKFARGFYSPDSSKPAGELFNQPGYYQSEVDVIADSTGACHAWLARHGVALSVISDRSLLDECVPRRDFASIPTNPPEQQSEQAAEQAVSIPSHCSVAAELSSNCHLPDESLNRRPIAIFCWHGDLDRDRGGGTTVAIDRLKHLVSLGLEVHLISRTPKTSEFEAICDHVWQFDESMPTQLHRYLTRRLSRSRAGRMLLKIERRSRNRLKSLLVGEEEVVAEVGTRMREQQWEFEHSTFRTRQNSAFHAGAIHLIDRLAPDLVIVSFAWNAPILDACSEGTLKIIDTHDIQHRRAVIAAEMGGDLSDRACSKEEEIDALRRADVLLAIQPGEQAILQSMCPDARVVSAGHVPSVRELIGSPPNSMNLLFIANKYDPNIRGLREFLRDDWPQLRDTGATLTVVGDVCGEFTSPVCGVSFLGRIDNLDGVYGQAAVVLNLATYGTGLPIKTIEGLARGKVVLSREECLEANLTDAPLLRFRSGGAMEAIGELLSKPPLRHDYEVAAWEYANDRLSEECIYHELDELLLGEDLAPTRLQWQLPTGFGTQVDD